MWPLKAYKQHLPVAAVRHRVFCDATATGLLSRDDL